MIEIKTISNKKEKPVQLQNPEKKITNNPDAFLRASDVAKLLEISRTTAYRLMRESIPVFEFGAGVLRVKVSDLYDYINQCRNDHEEVDK